jgi:hypothetical protein
LILFPAFFFFPLRKAKKKKAGQKRTPFRPFLMGGDLGKKEERKK